MDSKKLFHDVGRIFPEDLEIVGEFANLAAIVLHLHHERRARSPDSPNEVLFAELLRTDRWISHAGLSSFPDLALEGGRKGRASAQGLREDVG